MTVNPNEEIQVRVTSHANHDTIVNSVVTVNGKPSIFRVKTEAATTLSGEPRLDKQYQLVTEPRARISGYCPAGMNMIQIKK